ncbi:MAG: cytidylate kinase-like family protein [Treponema sp.]|nr:cytidylate kinase-like family protein [Treponema sp.]
MGIVAISRQVAALGDEIAAVAAKKLGYTFVSRTELEARIVRLGFPADRLIKYDEKKPSFFSSLAKERDDYLQYLQTAVLEAANEGNCILIGRGACVILEEVPNLVSLRFVAKDSIRLQRLAKEFTWTEKQAQQRISESDSNRGGFNKSFFGIDINDATHFHLVMNTGIINADEGGTIIANLVDTLITPERDSIGREKIKTMLAAQQLVNKLIFEHKVAVEFLHAVINDKTILLRGIAESSAIVEHTLELTQKTMPGYVVQSAISIVQDFKMYQ